MRTIGHKCKINVLIKYLKYAHFEFDTRLDSKSDGDLKLLFNTIYLSVKSNHTYIENKQDTEELKGLAHA